MCSESQRLIMGVLVDSSGHVSRSSQIYRIVVFSVICAEIRLFTDLYFICRVLSPAR